MRPDLLKLLVRELADPQVHWWISFADSNLPKGSQFLGATVVRAGGIASALRRTHELGINPGGEVAFEQVPEGGVPPEMLDVLVTSRERVEEIVLAHRSKGAS